MTKSGQIENEVVNGARRPTLPSDHAFVVQFRVRAAGEAIGVAGRVQHLRSGEATHFESHEQLLGFTTRVLDRLEEGCRSVSHSRNGAPREQSALPEAPQT